MGTTAGNEEVSGYFSLTLLRIAGTVQNTPPLPKNKKAGPQRGPAFLFS
jgi:hypothetical protein